MFITVNALVSALGGFIVGLVYGYKYIFMFIGFPIILCLVMWGGNKWADHVFNQYKTAGTESTEKAVSILTEFRTVKAFDQEMKESNDFRSELMNERSILTKVSLIRGLTECLSIATLIAMALTIIWYMFKQMVEDPESMPMFDMSCIIMGIFMLTIGIKMALGMSDNFLSAKSAARNICAIIELKPEIDPKKGRKIKDVKGKIEFRDVSFRYKGCEQYALKNLSFVINAGETVAFVGESGCGKSTTLQLLQRFYEIESGQILVDDVDIREISPRSLRSNISIVPQTPVLFSMTIADNIKYGRHTASDEEAAQAATTGNAHNFIMELPENYRTKVMQTSLSGGQKQRICISRAILSPTPILLLDEATAALDTESEQLVQQSLENFRHNNTCIMVAHRLATVLNSDRILVFKDGCIAESGTHKELLAANGIYSDLSRFQLQ
ncbi:ABC transporter family protein [Tritrichomonas foetus]|uniref:ABC transporter family protein n=1 Tax=Tritrichomonas foetus TaxID=1144522 RepID=A0A1J4JZJ1_9EUKA|nr:ABC transporter family protein [Tritrichomonas foetus]|eukprot:OHT02948.1 ABC transporter family protein [Tritrichomonas foetus]